jgi:RING-box protein 1
MSDGAAAAASKEDKAAAAVPAGAVCRKASLTEPIATPRVWNCVSMWSHQGDDENCSICRSTINDVCIQCQTLMGQPNISCNIGWGACNHAFHVHCISTWIKSHSTCPLCSEPWQMERVSKN